MSAVLPDEPLLSVPVVAEFLGWSRARGYRCVADGVLPSVRLSTGRIVVPRDALQAWLSNQAEQALTRSILSQRPRP